MGVSLYKGEAARRLSTTPPQLPGAAMEVFIGHVLDVSYEDPVPGVIRVKIISIDRQPDDSITRVAIPADMNMIKYPLPGELVLMFNGVGSSTIKDIFSSQLYYVSSISSNSSITFNSNPSYSTMESAKTIGKVVTEDYKRRFEKKLVNYPSFTSLKSNTIVDRPEIRPIEGDLILQGRFGSSIRLGSSGNEKTGVSWSSKNKESGDPIAVFSVDKTTGALARTEDVNLDQSSVYVCSSQVIPVVMSTSRFLKTHHYLYDVTPPTTEERDLSEFVSTPYQEGIRREFNETTSISGSRSRQSVPASFNLREAEAYTYQLLMEREGTSLIPGWDINNWRIGHGSSTITLLPSKQIVNLPKDKKSWPSYWINRDKGILGFTDIGDAVDVDGYEHHDASKMLWKGKYSFPTRRKGPAWNPPRPNPPDIITNLEADYDLARRIRDEFLPGVRNEMAKFANDAGIPTQRAVDNIGPGAMAALASIKYNYGNIFSANTWGNNPPAKVAARGNRDELVAYILNIKSGSADRHKREAEYASGTVQLNIDTSR